MARSIRRTPIFGYFAAPSDKPFKRSAARRYRAAVKRAMRSGRFDSLPDRREIADIWESPKDGKCWHGGLGRLAPLLRK